MIENGGDLKTSLSRGTSAIIGVNVFILRLQHVTQFNWIDRNVARSFRIEKLCRVKDFKYYTPWWQCLSCRCFRNKRTNGCRALSVTVCCVPTIANSGSWVLLFARSSPFGPIKGECFGILEVLLIVFCWPIFHFCIFSSHLVAVVSLQFYQWRILSTTLYQMLVLYDLQAKRGTLRPHLSASSD